MNQTFLTFDFASESLCLCPQPLETKKNQVYCAPPRCGPGNIYPLFVGSCCC